jgi:hypothetical protein
MIKRAVAALSLALMLVPFIGAATSAQASEIVDSQIVERVECLFRVYINEGGENGLDCFG